MSVTDRTGTQEMQTNRYRFDSAGRFVIQDFGRTKPFASFLPGIAGTMGIPLWVFTVNRGQAIASFGVEHKDHPIMEFFPANYAYQNTPYVGFRTFIKLQRDEDSVLYEPFAPWNKGEQTRMSIGLNDLELEAVSRDRGLRTGVVYFVLPDEQFAALIRQVTVTNLTSEPLRLEMLDGMPRVMPYGVDNTSLKLIGRTLEAWMGVSNLATRMPFFQFRATPGDTVEVGQIKAGNFCLAFTADQGTPQLLPALVDPVVVFGQNTSLQSPEGFMQRALSDLEASEQVTAGRTPCGFFGLVTGLGPGKGLTLYEIFGHAGSSEILERHCERLVRPGILAEKRQEGAYLARDLTNVVATQSGSPLFDAYCRQTQLDNILRGGWPLILAGDEKQVVYHVYSRKHGDLERDYNAFFLAATPFSQGNGNYRDVCQNRRCDVFLEPRVQEYDVLSFLSLIQLDGYNPLVVEGSRFVLSQTRRQEMLALVDKPEALEGLLAQPFSPGEILRAMADLDVRLQISREEFVRMLLQRSEQLFQASFGEGYWIDHWFYNLDLIDSYLAIYPERKHELLFDRQVTFFDSPAVVRPRRDKYVLTPSGVRQYGAVTVDQEKAALIASRDDLPDQVRVDHGRGAIYRATVMSKLIGLALIKFATMDPFGMGIEMEAGRPGWYDALNGLPGLLGSSLPEVYQLVRLLTFLLESAGEAGDAQVELPRELAELLDQVVHALRTWKGVADPGTDIDYWDAVATSRETYRDQVRLGPDGQMVAMTCRELIPTLEAFRERAQLGISRAVELSSGVSPTYLAYQVTEYLPLIDETGESICDEEGRPRVAAKRFEVQVMPHFLEGPMHAIKVAADRDDARRVYRRVRDSELFDRELGMYKVNAPLAAQSYEIGRARAFTPGWLENESIWLHMAYKYLLSFLEAGLYPEFFREFEAGLVPFQDPSVYGRSPLENSSFIVSSAHPDRSLHGAGFVARLSGATAEFLSIWFTMMVGRRPFIVHQGELRLVFRPALPGWLFDEAGTVHFTFLGHTKVSYHNPQRLDVTPDSHAVGRWILHLSDGSTLDQSSPSIGHPFARQVRDGSVHKIEIYLEQRKR